MSCLNSSRARGKPVRALWSPAPSRAVNFTSAWIGRKIRYRLPIQPSARTRPATIPTDVRLRIITRSGSAKSTFLGILQDANHVSSHERAAGGREVIANGNTLRVHHLHDTAFSSQEA